MEPERAYACFDPCCGEGTILRSFADELKQVGIQLDTYGVEVDANRYGKAKEQLDVVVRSGFESMMISHDYFPLIFLNPTYNTEFRTENTKSEKMEFNFLKRAHHYLQEGGIMVYVIPYDKFARDDISYFIAKHYEEIGLMRLGDENEEFASFKQCVFIGRKRATRKNDPYFNDRFANFCENMSDLSFVKKHVNTLAEMVNRKEWVIPELRHQNKLIFTSRVDYKSAYEGVGKSEGISSFKKRLNRGNGYSLQGEKTAAEAMNGEATSDGLNAMLGDTGDLKTLLIQNIKSGNQLKGSTEEWTKAASDESKRVLANIGNVITPVFESIEIQFTNWVEKLPGMMDVAFMKEAQFLQRAVECIKKEQVPGVRVKQNVLEIDGEIEDVIRALTTLNTDKRMLVQKQDITFWDSVIVEVDSSKKKGNPKNKVINGQFEFDLFG